MKTLTFEEIQAIGKKHEYILLRTEFNQITPLNTRMFEAIERGASKKIPKYSRKNRSRYISYRECSFIEYINTKDQYFTLIPRT